MKLRVLIGFLCLLAATEVKAQCNASFLDTSSVCGVFNFTNTSTGTNSMTSFSWTFASATTPSSSAQTPSNVTYTANGTYTICLSIANSSPFCTSNICQTISINCFTTTCAANFNSISCVQNGTNALVSFVNTSSSTNSTTVYDWDFGNSTTSTLTSPTGTYGANGTYTVCMSYTTYAPAYCTDNICKTITVGCIPGPTCSTNFSILSCVPNGTNAQVSFTNISTGTTSATNYTWTLGNNTTSNLQNPSTTYTANGIYTVCLTMADTISVPSCSATICKTVDVNCIPVPTCQANFTNTPCNNGQTTFYSISTGTNSSTTYMWTNNNPPAGSTPYTPTICLVIMHNNTVPTCSSSICKTVTIDCTGIGFREFFAENTHIKLFPNPGNGLFLLDLSQVNFYGSELVISAYNILGDLVYKNTIDVSAGTVNREIDLQYLPNGVYYLRVINGNRSHSIKAVIAR